MTIFTKFLPWPFSNTIHQGLEQADLVSNICIWLIIGFFSLMLVSQFIKASRRNKSIRKATAIIQSFTPDRVAGARQSIDDHMGKIETVGELWHEFNETLVQTKDGTNIYNTLDAEHFFNPSSLGQGIVDNRFVLAVPGMLTAMGVFGTFVGLQYGLDSLDLTTPEKMSSSMASVVAGAATAFKTSVWGILASLLFNMAEKIIEGNLTKKIRFFQFKTDRLFDRTLGEQALLDIQGNTSESEQLLRHLGEQIGAKVQEGISSAVGPQMEKLGRVMEELAERQASGAETALKKLVESFSSKLSEAGQQQAESMSNSAEALSLAMDRLDKTIGTFLEKVESQISGLSDVVNNNQKVTEESQLKAEEIIKQSAKTHEQFSDVSTEVSAAAEAIRSVVEGLQSVSQEFSNTVSNFASTQSNATAALQSTASSFDQTSKAISQVGQSIEKSNQAIETNVAQISEINTSMVENLALLPERHKEVLTNFFNELAQDLEKYKNSTNSLLTEFAEMLQGQTNHRINEWTDNTQQFCNNMKDAVEFLNATISQMKATMSNRK